MTTNPVKDFHAILGENEQMLVRRTGFSGQEARFIRGTAGDVAREQDAIVAHLREHRDEQCFHALRLSDGTEPWIAPILFSGGCHNVMAPPCFNPTTNEVFVQVRSAYGVWDGGGEVRAFTGFGTLDVSNGRVTLLDHGYVSQDPVAAAGRARLSLGLVQLHRGRNAGALVRTGSPFLQPPGVSRRAGSGHTADRKEVGEA